MSDSAAIKGLGSYLTSSFREFAISRGLTQEIINDYAALKAERDALASENGRMKKAIKRIFPEGVADEKSGIGFSDMAKECYASADEIPATDAFLNSVRAEGLKMAIDHMKNQTSYDCADVTVLPVIQMYNQLRAGKDGE